MEESWWWPFKGGNWRERLKAVAYLLLLVAGWVSIFLWAWLIDGK